MNGINYYDIKLFQQIILGGGAAWFSDVPDTIAKRIFKLDSVRCIKELFNLFPMIEICSGTIIELLNFLKTKNPKKKKEIDNFIQELISGNTISSTGITYEELEDIVIAEIIKRNIKEDGHFNIQDKSFVSKILDKIFKSACLDYTILEALATETEELETIIDMLIDEVLEVHGVDGIKTSLEVVLKEAPALLEDEEFIRNRELLLSKIEKKPKVNKVTVKLRPRKRTW